MGVFLFFLLVTGPSRHCIQSQFDKPASAQVLSASRDGRLSSPAPPQRQEKVDWRRRRQTGVAAPPSDGVLLKFPQVSTSGSPPPVFIFNFNLCWGLKPWCFFQDGDDSDSPGVPQGPLRALGALPSARA